MLLIQVEFLRGIFAASEPTATQSTEWPPAPARLFSALVAGAYSIGADPAPLTALETAPQVWFGDALSAAGGRAFAPAAYLAKGKTGWSRPGRPLHRPQMVRVSDPLCYAWDVDLDPEWLRPVLDAVTYLGRAESVARLSMVSQPPAVANHLAPDAYGEELLRVPEPGWLGLLQASYLSPSRVPPLALAPYAAPRRASPSPWGELLVLRPDGGDVRHAVALGDALRRAAMSRAPEQMSPVLHGHDKVPHAAWLTLPDVGHQHAQGRVLGLGLLLPKGVARADRDEAAAALGAVDHISVGGSHIALRHQPSHQPPPIGIERRTWARASTTWATATPIVLDRHPKRGQTVEGLIADACERWGYPRPTAVDVSPFSPLRGVPVAQAFRPRNRGRWTHAVIEWSKPQSGPVLLGREQHFGLGLLRPMTSRSGGAR